MFLSAKQGDNSDLFPEILEMYVPTGAIVADVTFGKGVFWKNVPFDKYVLYKSDLVTLEQATDFRSLPYTDGSIDALVLDPPYIHGGDTLKESIRGQYHNETHTRGVHGITRLYAAGIIEASRVLRRGGIIIVKCMDEIESGKQQWHHRILMDILERFGYTILDLYVLLQKGKPTMRHETQKHARKNHSYFIVGRFRG